MKTMRAPGQQECAVLSGSYEGRFVERGVVLAHGFACDNASREYDFGIVFVGGLRVIQQCVFASARWPDNEHKVTFEF
jgi:hypothetical protein